jgi:hypothetical protein
MMIASALRVQRTIRVAGRRLYSDSTPAAIYSNMARPNLVRKFVSRNGSEETELLPWERVFASAVKVANTTGDRLPFRFLDSRLRVGDELHSNDTFVPLPFNGGNGTVYGPSTS